MSDIPADLLYTSEHEWMRITDNKAEIGITNHAQSELGDIVYVELPALDDEIDTGDEFGTIESVKNHKLLYSYKDIDILVVEKSKVKTFRLCCYRKNIE